MFELGRVTLVCQCLYVAESPLLNRIMQAQRYLTQSRWEQVQSVNVNRR